MCKKKNRLLWQGMKAKTKKIKCYKAIKQDCTLN